MPRSASRMPWMMTCFALCAAMRPHFFVSTGTLTWPPTFARLLMAFAASSVSWVAGFSTSSTTSLRMYMSIFRFSSLISITTLSAASGLSLRKAASIA